MDWDNYTDAHDCVMDCDDYTDVHNCVMDCDDYTDAHDFVMDCGDYTDAHDFVMDCDGYTDAHNCVMDCISTYTQDWIDIGKSASRCLCKQDCVRISMSLFDPDWNSDSSEDESEVCECRQEKCVSAVR